MIKDSQKSWKNSQKDYETKPKSFTTTNEITIQ